MPHSTLFLGQSSRFAQALRQFDPFLEELLLRIADPVDSTNSSKCPGGHLPWLRLTLVWAAVVAPIFVFCLLPAHRFGGAFFGEQQPRRGSSTFSTYEIRDLSGIVNRLTGQSDRVSAFLWQRLSGTDQEMLRHYQPSAPSSNQVQYIVVQSLNNIIEDTNIYECLRFQGITLRPETTDLLGFPTFSLDEIKDLSGVVDRLTQRSNQVSAFLWRGLSKQDQEMLMNYKPSARSLRKTQDVVVQALNKIIREPSIYESKRFQGILLRPETTNLLKQSPTYTNLARLNRLLLEDAYPREFSRSLEELSRQSPTGTNVAHLNRLLLEDAYPHELSRSLRIRIGLSHDFARCGQFALLWCWFVLIIWGRRLLGLLLILLQESKVVGRIESFDPAKTGGGGLLRFFEWASRLTAKRCVFWIALLLIINSTQLVTLLQTAQKASAGNSSPLMWWTSANPYSFSPPEQVNLAGIWHFVVLSTVNGYIIVMIFRLLTVFACLAQQVASNKTLRIMPTHPDTTGGLLIIGQAALFFSLFILSSGIFLAGLTIQSIMIQQRANWMSYVLWGTYFILAPVLFFAPLLPLRKAMVNAKRDYLDRAHDAYSKVEEHHLMDIDKGMFNPTSLEGQAALGGLIKEAGKMAVWPLDKTTLRRFFGVFISPLLPVILEHVPVLKTALESIIHRGD